MADDLIVTVSDSDFQALVGSDDLTITFADGDLEIFNRADTDIVVNATGPVGQVAIDLARAALGHARLKVDAHHPDEGCNARPRRRLFETICEFYEFIH